jgi:hypothetical protein
MYYLYVYVIIYVKSIYMLGKNTYYMQCRLDNVLLAVKVHGEGHTLERQLARSFDAKRARWLSAGGCQPVPVRRGEK